MASTPPPPSPTALRVPGAPRHGAGYDMYSPYPTRYSARLASQRASRAGEQTPPPTCPGSPSKMRSKGAPKRCVGGNEKSSSTSDKGYPMDDVRSKPTTRGFDYLASQPASLTYDSIPNSHIHSSTHALPTPAKTPSKKKVSPDLSSTSRALFPSGTMSQKKPAPFSLESFDESVPGDKAIEIFTDSRDRVPKVSTSDANPFIARDCPPTPRATRSTRSVEAPSAHGVRYNFRGKTFIKEFVDMDEEDDTDDELGLFKARPDLLTDPDLLTNVKTLSRSSIAPRTLWPTKTKPQTSGEEETLTDEEITEKAPAAEVSGTLKSPISTPQSPEGMSGSGAPPGAPRTRSSARFDDDTELTPSGSPGVKRKRISPFDRWQRKKGKEGSVRTAPGSPAKRTTNPRMNGQVRTV
ncbi:hypothetical protein N7492_008313 [Penicillium capsulatum]|uniref:Uncharacterized protein n=1 Tax=Penicillium capsulatum TaxID=69766 RepID=A0A9W9HSF7_9EURO|nr:hypothetical protein N7492_008313 [Penicillium capsulatum]KAJ6105717.1 hypothetical protein N7512_009234 [Penicillium capsulatum]